MRPGLRCALLAAALLAAPARAGDLLGPGQALRAIPFETADLRPMIRARVGGTPGRLMFDLGTPDDIFLNRDAVPLDAGVPAGGGTAASGQAVTVRLHAAPEVIIAGAPFAAPDPVRSGPFAFAEAGLGSDFLGFIGATAVAEAAFVLDYGLGRLTLLRAGADGALAVPPPPEADVLARLAFDWAPGGLPAGTAALGPVPVGLDLDTGDRGTIYLRPATRAALEAAGVLRAGPDDILLADIAMGGMTFLSVPLRHVAAGGAEDFRDARDADLVRIGAEFLSRHPSLWNFPAGTLLILRPGSAYPASLR